MHMTAGNYGNCREMAKKFKPVKRPGALTAKAKKSGEGVQEFARKNYSAGGLLGEQARFAVTAKGWKHGKS
jgi:hypothetical protein